MVRTIEDLEKRLNDIRILEKESELYYINILIQQAECKYKEVIKREKLKEFIQLEEVQKVLIEYRKSKLGSKRLKRCQKYSVDYGRSKRGKEVHKKYRQSEKYKKNFSKRRELGFVSLNSWFNGSEAHHLDEEKVLYIPKKLHKSVSHDVYTGKNMSEINRIALEWFKDHR